MKAYRLGLVEELFRLAPAFPSVYEAAYAWTASDNYKFEVCESHLFVYEDDDLILTVEFGAYWDRWFDKSWNRAGSGKRYFEFFCSLIQRYVRRLIRCRLKEQV